MSGYGRFACYYDKLTENVDYGKIAARCHELIKRYSSEHEVVLDLACGTGSLSEALARLDYDVVGVDLSDQMLEEAMDKRYESGLNIQYLMQDIKSPAVRTGKAHLSEINRKNGGKTFHYSGNAVKTKIRLLSKILYSIIDTIKSTRDLHGGCAACRQT